MSDKPLIAELADLLDTKADELSLVPGEPGGNNRIFVVSVGIRRLIAKVYFQHPSDPRDRLKAEFGFLTYARRLGVACVPQPVACSPAGGLGVYEYVEGSLVAPGEITSHLVDQAIRFFLEINQGDGRSLAAGLPVASEACFSIAEHFGMVDSRIDRLAAIPAAESVDREALEFVGALRTRWREVKATILRRERDGSADPTASVVERCVSPSDFGFHNAILRPSGEVCFIDFEYAGWDDPAKMAGDFFCHPALPVGMDHFERFLTETMRFSDHAEALAERARLLFPVFQTKWCCIILNGFLPDSARRRRFADPSFDVPGRKRTQLEKSRRLFDSIRT